jgi:hypothetical protein
MASTYELVSCKGHKLHCEEYLPVGGVKGIFLWHHGIGDHIARYTHCTSCTHPHMHAERTR